MVKGQLFRHFYIIDLDKALCAAYDLTIGVKLYVLSGKKSLSGG